MSDLFERIRADAAPLRYDADAMTLSRIAARVREGIAQPTVAQLLAMWLRPLAASLAAVALAAVIALSQSNRSSDDTQLAAASSYEISMAGSDYSVGN